MSPLDEVEQLQRRAAETRDLANQVRQLEALVAYLKRELERRDQVGVVSVVELVAVDVVAGTAKYRSRS